jgi:hypothetical protein
MQVGERGDYDKLGQIKTGVYILENIPPPRGERKNISPCHLGKKYEMAKRKKGENVKERKEKGKKKEEKGKKKKRKRKKRGKKMRKGEVKG